MYIFIPNRPLKYGHGALRILSCALPMPSAFIAPATALAVGSFEEQGCERSELPCLSFGGEGARPKVLVCFPLNHGSLRGKARLKSRRMPIISPLSLVPLHASKANGNQDNHPPSTATITTNLKKDQGLRLDIYAMCQAG